MKYPKLCGICLFPRKGFHFLEIEKWVFEADSS